jgi:multiple sugar transport system substrate-binding protein
MTRVLVPTRRTALLAWIAVAAALLTGCDAAASDEVTLRLWDPQVAEAYRASLDDFEESTGIQVDVVVVPWADYWTQLRADVGAGVADDVFWLNAANFQDYVEAGAILPVPEPTLAAREHDWVASAVAQYSLDGRLWGVPQITDPGIGLLYNADLLAEAGMTPDDVAALTWDPAAADDELRRTARELTLDDAGRHPGQPGFDPTRVRQYGFGAANDLNGVLLQFLAGNGATWQEGDEFTFASDAGIAALGYVAALMTTEHVAPSGADSNPPTGGDFVRDQFVQGRVALFPTGAYNLANVADGAGFSWGVAPLPSGPAGAISVTNSVVAAANARSDAPQAQRLLLEWLGSTQGLRPIGDSGSALPAARSAQTGYTGYWAERGVDVSPMIDVLRNGDIQPPQGARYPEAATAMRSLLNDVFLGRRDPASGLRAAQDAANAAMVG